MGIVNFLLFFSFNSKYYEFWEPKSGLNPFPIYRVFQFQSFKNYFPAHYLETCVMSLLVPILKRSTKYIPSLGWKFVLALVGNSCTYRLDMDPWLGMDGSTIFLSCLIFFGSCWKSKEYFMFSSYAFLFIKL